VVNPVVNHDITMKTMLRLAYFGILYGMLHLSSQGSQQSGQAPYFVVLGDRGESTSERLPLKSSSAEIRIDGTIARIRLTQHYGNTGTRPIEARYVFPASTRAAVHGMKLSTGERVIAARIRESKAAKAEYQEAKRSKKTAALLEEYRPNVFQMSVANLIPGDDVKVEIEWSETVPASDSTYELVFPTVVGPRYSGAQDDGPAAAEWAANPHLTKGVANPAGLDLDVTLSTALPLAEVTSPSHPLRVDFQSKSAAKISIDPTVTGDPANRDFILRWKLGGDQVDAGLLLHQDGENRHFLLQIEPPARVSEGDIPPRDYVMVVDVSGSMNGFPLNTTKKLLDRLVSGLKPTDTFNVLCFASGSGLMAEQPLAATPENLRRARVFIDSQDAGGGTELEAALQRALALPGGGDRSRSILLVTDGYVTADERVTSLIRGNIGSANLFAFGIGSSVNRHLIESVARAGGGEPVVVTRSSDAAPAAEKFLEAISRPVLAKVRIEGIGVDLAELEPAPHPDVFASRPLVINGTWKGKAEGRIIVRGIAGNGKAFEKSLDLAEAAKDRGVDHPALPVLWARERVRRLSDLSMTDTEAVREIISLGLKHSLLTSHTSFIAVDETPRNFEGEAMTVKQPLPLPQGVEESAVGGSGKASICGGAKASVCGGSMVANGSVPEPGALGLVSLLVVLLALQRRR
jgi:Ca-activated chloride channel family protein